jgi:hypothetical protein
MNGVANRDADSVVLRLLCEKAQERLERVSAAVELGHRTVQLPDGSYVWAKETEPPAQGGWGAGPSAVSHCKSV